MTTEVTKEQFIADLQAEIDQAILQAQGMIDWKRQKSAEEIANDVANWLPDTAWAGSSP